MAKIHFHLIRHWFGTIEYYKTHDPDHVRRLLGRRSILPTQIYINLEQTILSGTPNYHVKAVSTVEEAATLIEVRFEHATEIDGKKLFKKRK